MSEQAVIRAANKMAASLESQLAEKEADNERLRAALAPFTRLAIDSRGNWHREDKLVAAAKAALEQKGDDK